MLFFLSSRKVAASCTSSSASPSLRCQHLLPEATPALEDRSILFGRHPNCHVVPGSPQHQPLPPRSPFASLPRSRSSWDMDFGSKDSAERYCGHGGRIYRLPWLSTSRAMEMENPLEPVAEDKEETSHQDDRADVVAGGRDKLPNAIPLVLPLPEFLSSCPLPPGIRQQSPERKEKEVEKSNFLSDVPTKILNSSPLPSVTEHQGASNDSEIGSEELKLSFCCANANFKLLDCATRNETAEP
ncbi:uncharacterized protein LOC122004885 isoform X1 [Zingiber officinale]|uniref:uncharacterized protein LOC122004885 isoform X1 n=1 Tax=Zingiber officinale TaxID=94328 RepID=UPI001C4A78BA|nr:uncharacterized protein LOC122004885 isoform X1 [Zingiber officinale]